MINHFRNKALIVCILLFANTAFAQSPVITSFSPSSGVAGSTVTINGDNFDTDVANNIVYFGAARATVISATTKQLLVMAPAGTTLQPISVTANGLTGYSGRPFQVTFTGPPFSAAKLNSAWDISTGSNVYGVAVKDLDGDGRSDIVAVNSNSNSVSVIKNTIVNGTLIFAPPINLPTTNYSTGVAVDDLNGDGKPDIVVTNYSNNTISIYRNTSSGGALSFDPPIMLNAIDGPYSAVIADFNGDGKPDIAVTNERSHPSYISVFTNNSAGGGSFAFAPPVSFSSGSSSRGIAAADIDGDGKIDMIATSQDGAVSVFRNTSAGNTINFADRTVLSIPGSAPESVAIADFDGDGKLDLAVADNNTTGSICVFKNASSPGVVSFQGTQKFAVTTNPFSVAVGDLNGDGKPDIAVTDQLSNQVSVLINNSVTSSGTISMAGSAEILVLDEPRSLVIGDMDGNSRPDLVIGNNGTSIVRVLLADASKAIPIITFPPIAQQAFDPAKLFNPGATSTNPAMPIVYTSSDPSIATVDANGLIHFISAGTVTITATQDGDNNFNAAAPVSQTLTILLPQTITFPVISNKNICTADFNVNATSSNNTIPLTYSSSNPAVATIDGTGEVHITGVGNTLITINQTGNAVYEAATPANQDLTVVPLVTPTVVIYTNTPKVCVGSSVTITANLPTTSDGSFIYHWTVNGNDIGSNSANLIVTNAIPTDVYRCVVSSPLSCFPPGISNDLTNINVVPYSTPTVIISNASNGPVCVGSSVSFSAVVGNVGKPSYQWKINGVNAGTDSPIFESNTFANNDQVTCDVVDTGFSCHPVNQATSNAIGVKITATPQLQAVIAITNNNVYEGQVIAFSASISDTTGVSKYQWQVNGKNAGTNFPVFSSSQLFNNDVVICIITSNASCSIPVKSNEIKLSLAPPLSIAIPDTFTPNGDGINDLWSIPALVSFPRCKVNVFNRYGTLVYHSVGYNKPWDGSINGSDLPNGVYYYVIVLNDTSKSMAGWLTIIR